MGSAYRALAPPSDNHHPSMNNPNHPKQGSAIKVDPIRERHAIQAIKHSLEDRPRDLCLFTLGINTAYRANELLSLTCGQVAQLSAGDLLTLRQTKTKKHRSITLNRAAAGSIKHWMHDHPYPNNDAPLFWSRSGGALTVSTISTMVKAWCREAGLQGNYGSHTLRKTWGYHQLRHNRSTPPHMVLPILMSAYGHRTQEQTIAYLSIQPDEVARLFLEVEL